MPSPLAMEVFLLAFVAALITTTLGILAARLMQPVVDVR